VQVTTELAGVNNEIRNEAGVAETLQGI